MATPDTRKQLDHEPSPRKTLRELRDVVLDLKTQYIGFERQKTADGQPWNGYDRTVGFFGDTQKFFLLKDLVENSSGVKKEEHQKNLGHHVADLFWSSLAVAHDYEIDLEGY